MRRRKIIRTTLGELIVSLTDEVTPFIREPSSMYLVVSCILSDLLTRRRAFPTGRRVRPVVLLKS